MCTNDLSTVNRFLCFTCNKLAIRSIAEKNNNKDNINKIKKI